MQAKLWIVRGHEVEKIRTPRAHFGDIITSPFIFTGSNVDFPAGQPFSLNGLFIGGVAFSGKVKHVPGIPELDI